MTAPVPSYWLSTNTAGGTSLAFTASVGDLLVIIQEGRTSGGAAPVAPTIGGSSTGLTDGAGASGSDLHDTDGVNQHGRVTYWSKVATSGDVSTGTVVVSQTGWLSHRAQVVVVPGNWSSTNSQRVFQATSARTSGTTLTLNDPPRAALALVAVGFTATQGSLTLNYDSAVSGVKFNRVPYTDENTTTTTTPTHTDHYGSGSGFCQSDYQEYDGGETPSVVAFSGGTSNSTHCRAVVIYQVANNAAIVTATETDAAQTITPSKNFTVGTATETDTAQTFEPSFLHLVATATETEVAGTFHITKTRAVGATAETDTAGASPGSHSRAAAPAAETDAAQTIGRLKSWSAEVSMTNPSASEQIIEAHLIVSKNYPSDVGDIRFALKQGAAFIQTSSWTAITDTPTQLVMTLSSPARGADFRVWWEVRTTDHLDPLISEPELITVGFIDAATETDAAQRIASGIAVHPGLTSGTGTSPSSQVLLAVAAGLTAGLGVAASATPSEAVNAGLTSGTGTARDGVSSLSAATGLASGTGTAPTPSLAVQATAGLASATGTAWNAIATSASIANASGGHAPAFAAANDPTIVIAPNVATATAIATSEDATTNVGSLALPAVASGAGTAWDATVTVPGSAQAIASTASGTGATNDAHANLGVPVAFAHTTGASSNPTIVVIGMGIALGVGIAHNTTTSGPPSYPPSTSGHRLSYKEKAWLLHVERTVIDSPIEVTP